MNYLLPFLSLVSGACLGGIAVWLILRARLAGVAAQVKAELQPQLATLAERVVAKEQQMEQLRASLAMEGEEKARIGAQLRDTASARAVIEEKCRHLEVQLEARTKESKQVQDACAIEHHQLQTTNVELTSATIQLQTERKAHATLAQKHEQAQVDLGKLQMELLGVKGLNGELAERARYLEERLATQKLEIESIQQRFQKDFEAIAHKLLVENSGRFGQQSAESLGKVLAPFNENLKDFRTKLDSVQQDAAAHSALLRDQIARIGTEAANLSKALKGDAKVLGNWGENMLDQILERSGLQVGVHYRRQIHARDETGEQRFLDVVVQLPEDQHLVIDSKVSLKAYEEYVNCDDEAGRGEHLEALIQSVRNHFRGLSAKRYHDIYGISTPDFVLMYVPIEAAYFLALSREPGLFSEALDKNVVLITNSTLLATLRTAAHVWRLADQQKHALEIAERGGKLYDKFVGFVTDLQGIGIALGDAQQVWAEATKKLHQGPGNLIGQVEKLRTLGVKASKKLPPQFGSLTDEEESPMLSEGAAEKAQENAPPELGLAG